MLACFFNNKHAQRFHPPHPALTDLEVGTGGVQHSAASGEEKDVDAADGRSEDAGLRVVAVAQVGGHPPKFERVIVVQRDVIVETRVERHFLRGLV